MKPAQRWPLHPTPVEGEALSSWLHRIARCYRMDVPDLLQHDLGHDGASDLDGAPPAALLEVLARRSGLSLDQLRSMSLAGWVPWLVDRLDPDPSAFETYAHQFSVLLPLQQRPTRTVPQWRAWLPRQTIHRACPQCLAEAENYACLLMWQLPLLLSCPRHGCWLESYWGVAGDYCQWEQQDLLPRQTSEAIAQMDRRTWQALTTGKVALPRRRVHAGVWLRLLRTLLDELNTPLSYCPSQARDIRKIWESCGFRVRAGLSHWNCYETLALPLQLQMLEAAAMTIQRIETGMLTAQGAQAELFVSVPQKSITDGYQLSKQSGEEYNPWALALSAAEKVIAGAQRNPEEAQALFKLLLFGHQDPESIRKARTMLAELEIPIEFLSH